MSRSSLHVSAGHKAHVMSGDVRTEALLLLAAGSMHCWTITGACDFLIAFAERALYD